MGDMQNDAKWKLTNARVTRVKELEKVAFITVSCMSGKYPNFYDLTCFDSHLLEGIGEGKAVTVTGDLSMRKPREQGAKWTLELIARRIEPGDERLAPRKKESRHSAPANDSDVDF
jgi:hypothetical protein